MPAVGKQSSSKLQVWDAFYQYKAQGHISSLLFKEYICTTAYLGKRA